MHPGDHTPNNQHNAARELGREDQPGEDDEAQSHCWTTTIQQMVPPHNHKTTIHMILPSGYSSFVPMRALGTPHSPHQHSILPTYHYQCRAEPDDTKLYYYACPNFLSIDHRQALRW